MKAHRLNAQDSSDLEKAAEILQAGGILAVPTETVYGLAADAANSSAVASIFEAKQRPSSHPLIIHVANVAELENWAVDVPRKAYVLAEAFWPGPLTLLLKKAPHVSELVTGGLATVGIRVPSHPVLHELLVTTGLGLAAPSANPYKQLSPTSAGQVADKLEDRIDGILDGGESTIGLESTIVDLTGDDVSVLRAGPISPGELEKVLGHVVSIPIDHDVVVSGNVKDHYQPTTPLYLTSTADIQKRMQSTAGDQGFVVHSDFSEVEIANGLNRIRMPKEKSDYARVLYKTLHQLDKQNLSAIWLECPPQTEEWLDVNDRLQRASHSS